MNTISTPFEARTGKSASRRSFLQKTYAHVLLAISMFVAMEVILFQTGIAFAIANVFSSSWLLVLGGFMVVGWMASRFASGDRPLGQQYIGLFLFVIAEALVFTPLLVLAVYYSDPSVLTSAIFTTTGIFLALTGYVYFTKTDFTFLRPFLFVIGIVALIAIVGATIFGASLGFYFSLAMALFAAGSVLHDTSNVMRNYHDDQYVAASLQLFASVALLFYYILQLFIGRR